VPPGTGSDALVRDDFGRLLLCRFGERSARSPAPQRSLIRNKSNQSINLEFMRMQLDPVAAVAVATVTRAATASKLTSSSRSLTAGDAT